MNCTGEYTMSVFYERLDSISNCTGVPKSFETHLVKITKRFFRACLT
jgi:hypothetical protein